MVATRRKVFRFSMVAGPRNVYKCHAYNDYGGNAGPRLNGVASRLSREQLLEALIKPSARLAPGYGMITLETKDGKTIAGILQEETNTSFKSEIR